MPEFNIFETMYPVVEELNADLEEKLKMLLIENYETLYKEYNRLKKVTSIGLSMALVMYVGPLVIPLCHYVTPHMFAIIEHFSRKCMQRNLLRKPSS